MVSNVMSYSGSGLRDWLVQRVSAVVLASYVVFLAIYIGMHSGMSYDTWHTLYAHIAMKVASLVVLLSLLLHSWIGIWTIFTDYVKPTAIRIFLEVMVILGLVACFFWGLIILWSVN